MIKRIMIFVLVIFFDVRGQSLVRNAHTIAVLGTGYVGLITGACLADFGHTVICADTDHAKINQLNQGKIPIYEPGLEELVSGLVMLKKLSFTTDIDNAIAQADCIFIAVGTPMNESGCADLSALNKAFSMIIPHLGSYKLICIKSTVPIGTGNNLLLMLQEKGINPDLYDLVSNPEFLREGSAIYDFMNPDRIVVGTSCSRALAIMNELYAPLIDREVPCLCTSITSSETIKYASNAFLATKLSFINEIANLCDSAGADIVDVSDGMGLDKRIGKAFLKPGPGFGGSCFPKDCHALCAIGKTYGVPLNLVHAALQTNEEQKKKAVEKLMGLMEGDILGKTIALLGLAFKNNTDDIRYSPALTTIELLLHKGAFIRAYDPAAMNNMRKIFPAIGYADSVYEAVSNADAVIIITEWDEFKYIDLERIGMLMNKRVLVDVRNLLDPRELQRHNFKYALMGRA